MSDNKEIRGRFQHCLSASVWWELHNKKQDLKESDLVKCDFMLYTKIGELSFESCIKKMLLTNVNFFLVEVNEVDIAERLKRDGYIILNVNSAYLHYSEAYRKSYYKDYHYIIILDKKGDEYFILDLYIPTKPSSEFRGWIRIQDLKECRALVISDYNNIFSSDNEVENLKGSIEHYLSKVGEYIQQIDNGIHSLMNTNNKNDPFVKEKLYKAAVDTAIRGVQASRKFFLEQYLKINCDSRIIDKYFEIDELYYRYRLLLMKNMVMLNKRNINSLFETSKKIIETEKEVFAKQLEYLMNV